MSLIEFQDYPSTETPLNAENLNHNFNELNKANTYSTEEQVIGTWIDGKKIYKKTFTGIWDGTGGLQIPHNLTNYIITNMYGIVRNPSSNTSFILNSNRPAYPTYEFGFYVNSSIIQFEVNGEQNRTGYEVYVTLEYIKTNE